MSETAQTAEPTDAEIIQELSGGLSLILNKYDALRAEYDVLRNTHNRLRTAYDEGQQRLAALESAFAERGALGVLQMFAHDPSLKPQLRISAAKEAVAYERAKPASAEAKVAAKLFDILEPSWRARPGSQGKVIDLAPERPSTPGTVLGNGGPDAA